MTPKLYSVDLDNKILSRQYHVFFIQWVPHKKTWLYSLNNIKVAICKCLRIKEVFIGCYSGFHKSYLFLVSLVYDHVSYLDVTEVKADFHKISYQPKHLYLQCKSYVKLLLLLQFQLLYIYYMYLYIALFSIFPCKLQKHVLF